MEFSLDTPINERETFLDLMQDEKSPELESVVIFANELGRLSPDAKTLVNMILTSYELTTLNSVIDKAVSSRIMSLDRVRWIIKEIHALLLHDEIQFRYWNILNSKK